MSGTERHACRDCGFFENDPALLEAAWPGLTALSSAYGSTRSQDGLCRRHDRYVPAESVCDAFERKR